jgi:DNA-binding MurR/RpiR family transcriptional regulator
MDVKIGVMYSPRELSLELEGKAEEMMATIQAALDNGTKVLWITDKKGRRVGVPTDKVAYVEIGEEDTTKRVGFGPG